MSQRRWGLLAGLGVIVAMVGLVSAGALRPRPAEPVAGQLDVGGKKEAPKPAGRLKPEAVRAEEAAIRKANKDFSAAYNKGDLGALVGLWTEDAEYTAETGKAYRGKEVIRALLKKSMATHKAGAHSIKVQSVRLVKPDVALVEGTVTLTARDGSAEHGRFSAVYSKHDGKWLISSVRDLPTPDDEEKPHSFNRLQGLAWLVGEWVDKETDKTITIKGRWAAGQAYLVQEITVEEGDGKRTEMRHLITWDPLNETVRSWMFDSTGGVSEGLWERDGNTWSVQSEGWFGDGRTAQALNKWRYVDDATFAWSSENRQADDRPLPDLKVTFVRKAKGKDR
jgi:uncharacterized protein (TIGR02246 family)